MTRDMERRRIYKTDFDYLEDIDPRAVEFCMQCGYCTEGYCMPAVEETPRVSCPLQGIVPGFETTFARGMFATIRALMEGRIEPSQEIMEDITKCMLCDLCKQICYYGNDPNVQLPIHRVMDHAQVFEALRANLLKLGLDPISDHIELLDSIRKYRRKVDWNPWASNPFGERKEDRINWTEHIDFEIKELTEDGVEAEYLWYVGCTAAYLDPDIAVCTAKVLNEADVDFGYLGTEEPCCGWVTKKIGEWLRYKEEHAEPNIELFNKLYEEKGVEKIVTSCTGCVKVLYQEYHDDAFYEEFAFDELKPEVLHISELLRDLIKENVLEFPEEGPEYKVVYHDPCRIGRQMGLFDTPREAIESVPQLELVEMEDIREFSRCCGGPIILKDGHPEISLDVVGERIKEAEETEADYLVSVCPECKRSMREGAEHVDSVFAEEADENFFKEYYKGKVRDLTEVLTAIMGL